MARTMVNRSLALKAFVEALVAAHPKATTFTRPDVEAIGKIHPIGFTEFASVANGYGSATRVGRGQYAIPAEWKGNKAPWAGVQETAPVVAKAKAKKAAPEVAKTKTKKAAPEVAESAVVEEPKMKKNVNPKKAMTKKELFEKAKNEIAKRKGSKKQEVAAGE